MNASPFNSELRPQLDHSDPSYQAALAMSPVHVFENRYVRVHRIAVDRNGHGALLAENRRYVRIEYFVVNRVDPAQHDDGNDVVLAAVC